MDGANRHLTDVRAPAARRRPIGLVRHRRYRYIWPVSRRSRGHARCCPYAELHCLSNFSFLRGASHPEELVERAHALGYGALALTDECSLAGVVRAHLAAKACGLKLLVGSEIALADGPKLVLLATDRASYGNLAQLITRGRRSAVKGTYALTRADVAALAEGLLALRPRRRWASQRGGGSPRRSRNGRGSRWSSRCVPATARASMPSTGCRRRAACRKSPRATSTCTRARAARCRTR
jgi:hypothetical protein